MQPDEELHYLQALQKGDQQAIEILVSKYYPALLNFLLRMGCQPGDAEDIIQETFIKAARGLRNYRHLNRFRIWLFKICHNNLRDFYKKASQRREIPFDPADLPVAGTVNPENSIIEQEQAFRVQAALNQLPLKQRLVIVLRYYHGFSLQEIALMTHRPVGTVKSRLNGALKSLKSIMREGDGL